MKAATFGWRTLVDRRRVPSGTYGTPIRSDPIRKASEIYVFVKNTKIGGFVVDRNNIDLYYKIGGVFC